MKAICCLLLGCAGLAAQPLLLDGRAAPGVALGGGLLAADRAAMRGVKVAEVACPDEARRERALIVGEDRDAGLLLLWSACEQDGAGEGVVLIPGMKLRAGAYETRVHKVVDSASFGFVFPLQNAKGLPTTGQALRDGEGQAAGWYAARNIDGQWMGFALGQERVRGLRRDRWQTPEEWNAAYAAEFEDAYQRAMAYLWVEDFEGAAFYLDKATRARPSAARAWFHFAFVEGKRGHTVTRLEYYRKALAWDADLAEAHYNISVSLLMSARVGEAAPHVAALHRLMSPLAERLENLLEAAHADEMPGKKQ